MRGAVGARGQDDRGVVSRYFDRKSAARVRRRERSRRGLWAGIWTAAVILAAGAAASAALHFRLHTVRAISVSGEESLAPDLRAAMEPCLGRPLWKSGAGALSEGFRRDRPAVERVRTAVLPWGVVLAEIKVRRPVARVERGGLAVDAEGMVFNPPDGGGDALPLLRLAGSNETGRRRALTAILTAGECEAAWTIDCADQDDIKLHLPGPAVVHLGNGRFPGKWSRLREILRNRGADPAPCIIDLRFHGQAVVRRQA